MFDSVNTAAEIFEQEASSSPAADQRFEQIKSALRRDIGDTAYRSWILPAAFVSFQSGGLEISVPTRFIRDWVKNHYADRIMKMWTQGVAPCNRIDITVDARKADAAPVTAFVPVAVANQNDTPDTLSSPLDPRFTFENFVRGPSNELALGACLKIAEGAAVNFNPLFLQGRVGLGKTHLMQATAAAIRAKDAKRRVIYMSAERFMYQFVRAIRAKDTMTFKEQFQNIDVLMIDDLQFICGKEQTQQEFFHTFNMLVDQGKQVILSADKSPAELDGIDDRLRSRLGMGLVAQVQPADHALRLEILKRRAAQSGRNIGEDVLSFLAEKISASVREIEGAFNRLIAHAELSGREISVYAAEDILQDLIRAGERRLSVEDIQKKVAEHYNIRISDILSPRRARPVARPRQVAMYLAKMLTEHSLPEIGRKFGGRDHTTIIHGVRKVEELMAVDTTIKSDVDTLRRALKN